MLVETSVTIDNASPGDIDCDDAAAFVAQALVAAGLSPEDAVYWVQPSENGQGVELVLQVPAESPTQAQLVLDQIEPQLGNQTALDALVQAAGPSASASYNSAGAVVDSPYIESGDDDGDGVPVWVWAIVAVCGAGVIACVLYYFLSGCCKRSSSEDEEENKRKKAAPAGAKAELGVVPAAQEV